MDDVKETQDCGGVEALLRPALKSQYHAALAMLQRAVEACPDELWLSDQPNRFWQVAYHALFFTHLYLQPNEAAFQPWEHHREEYQFIGKLPWPPYRPPNIGEPYTKPQVLDYLLACDAMIDLSLDATDLTARESGFWWYKMSKLEHQIVNIRHIQDHAAHLAIRLRAAGCQGVNWVGSLA